MSDTKHGWVTPRADGARARCGGPGVCATCDTEAMHEAMLTGVFGVVERPAAAPCQTCNGHGMVGGLTPHSGYDSEPCPDCTPPASAQDDAKDAARWRAFVGCARIRPLGSAGLEQPEPNHYAHMGLEIWTRYGRDYPAPLLKKMDDQNERARRWLVMFADVAIAASQQQEG